MKTKIFVAAAALIALTAPVYAQDAAAAAGATVGGTSGAVAGAVTGGLIFGPIGAIIGGFTGATIGANAGIAATSVDYVRLHPTEPVVIEGRLDTGYRVPKTVKVHPIEGDPDHGYFYTNDRVYIVSMNDGAIVYSPGTVVAGK